MSAELNKPIEIGPRTGLALDTANQDKEDPEKGASSKTVDEMNADKGLEFIKTLWNDDANQTVVNRFMTNPQCDLWRKGVEDSNKARETYRNYAIQDFFYLCDFIKFKALRLTTIPQSEYPALRSEAESVGSMPVNYIEAWSQVALLPLKVDIEDLHNSDRAVAELAYANFLQNNVGREDWFNLHIIMIACIYGWSKLAVELYNKEGTKKSGIFYESWIKPSITIQKDNTASLSSSALKLLKFVGANVDFYRAENKGKDTVRWNTLFRTALRLETALFASADNPYGD